MVVTLSADEFIRRGARLASYIAQVDTRDDTGKSSSRAVSAF